MSSTTYYARFDETPAVGILPASFLGNWAVTPSSSAYAGPTAKYLNTLAGTTQYAVTPTWPATIPSGQEITMGHAQLLSPPLATQFINPGTWTFGFAVASPNGTFWSPYVAVSVVDGHTGLVRSTIIPVNSIDPLLQASTSEYTSFGTLAGNSANVINGDYLAIEFGVLCAGPGLPNTSVYANGSTPITIGGVSISSAQSFVTVPQALIPFITPPITIPLSPTLTVTTNSPAPTGTSNLYDIGFGTDLVIGPTGDLSVVTGKTAFMQHLYMLLVSPRGSLYSDPEWGDGLVGLIGTPGITSSRVQSYINNVIVFIDALGVTDGVGIPQVVTNSVVIDSLSGYYSISMDILFPDGSTQTLSNVNLQGAG